MTAPAKPNVTGRLPVEDEPVFGDNVRPYVRDATSDTAQQPCALSGIGDAITIEVGVKRLYREAAIGVPLRAFRHATR